MLSSPLFLHIRFSEWMSCFKNIECWKKHFFRIEILFYNEYFFTYNANLTQQVLEYLLICKFYKMLHKILISLARIFSKKKYIDILFLSEHSW